MPAADLLNGGADSRARERGARGVVQGVVAIGSLPVVRARALHGRDRSRVALKKSPASIGNELVLAALETQNGIASQAKGIANHQRRQRIASRQLTVHLGDQAADRRLVSPEFLLHAREGVLGP